MLKAVAILVTLLSALFSSGQSCNLVMKGDFTRTDSLRLVEAFSTARSAVEDMRHAMNRIWDVDGRGNGKVEQRKQNWEGEKAFTNWLGKPDKLGLVKRKINKIARKFDKKIVLNVAKENKGRCSGWISAWAIPFGQIRITLCEDYFIYRTRLQEKTLIHEMGHETGILFHRKIHGCRAARLAANADDNAAKRSTENYAWLAMSYKGLECRN